MFDTSFLLLLKHLIIQILIPLIPGIVFLWIFFGKKIKGLEQYLLARFLGSGVVALSMFNLQFVRFGVGGGEYLLLLGILLGIRIAKIIIKKEKFKDYFHTLSISINLQNAKKTFVSMSTAQKIFFCIALGLILTYLITSFVWTSSFPSYSDDTFGNWHKPVINILHDGGVHLFGAEDQILGRGRLGYPIMIPILKAIFSKFAGGFNDIYINLRQRLNFFFGLLLIGNFSFKKTKNPNLSILPILLICGMPLVFIHATSGYLDLASAIYSVVATMYLIRFLDSNEYRNLPIVMVLLAILSQLKNDGIVIYVPAIVGGFALTIILQKKLKSFFIDLRKNKNELGKTIGFAVFFFLPFLAIKMIHGLGFNQAAGAETSIEPSIHREIFSTYKHIFFQENNYNIFLAIIVLLIIILSLKKKIWKYASNKQLAVRVPLATFGLFTLVFLLTANYKWVLDQTTVNRVYTMSFLIFGAFSGYLLSDEKNNQ